MIETLEGVGEGGEWEGEEERKSSTSPLLLLNGRIENNSNSFSALSYLIPATHRFVFAPVWSSVR